MEVEMKGKLGRFPSMPNFRQLVANNDDTPQKEGYIKLFRSSKPDSLTEEEMAAFNKLGIRSIIDCRTAGEYGRSRGHKIIDKHYPAYELKVAANGKDTEFNDTKIFKPVTDLARQIKLAGGQRDNNTGIQGNHFLINFYSLKYFKANFDRVPWNIKIYLLLCLLVDVVLGNGYKNVIRCLARNTLNNYGIGGQYLDWMRYSHNKVYVALKLLSEPHNVPAMVNCAIGKDRTGVISALVLACFGKSKEYIAADYARSEEELAHVHHAIHNELCNKLDLSASFTSAKASTMLRVLEQMEEEFGSLLNYMEYIGFTAEDQTKLRKNLTYD